MFIRKFLKIRFRSWYHLVNSSIGLDKYSHTLACNWIPIMHFPSSRINCSFCFASLLRWTLILTSLYNRCCSFRSVSVVSQQEQESIVRPFKKIQSFVFFLFFSFLFHLMRLKQTNILIIIITSSRSFFFNSKIKSFAMIDKFNYWIRMDWQW